MRKYVILCIDGEPHSSLFIGKRGLVMDCWLPCRSELCFDSLSGWLAVGELYRFVRGWLVRKYFKLSLWSARRFENWVFDQLAEEADGCFEPACPEDIGGSWEGGVSCL